MLHCSSLSVLPWVFGLLLSKSSPWSQLVLLLSSQKRLSSFVFVHDRYPLERITIVLGSKFFVPDISPAPVKRSFRLVLDWFVPIFIPKPGKEDYSPPKSYRPITLSSFVLKGSERIMLWYLREKLITKALESQHAYTRGLLNESALSEVLDYVESSFYRRKKVIAVSLDCTGDFDCIGFDAASDALITKGVPKGMTLWYTNLLKGRKVTANLQGVTQTITPGRGNPQGGILSHLAWNLVMDSLLKEFQAGPVKAVGYADDVIIMASGIDMRINAENIQLALNQIINWGKAKGLVFNPSKTQPIIFDMSKKYKVSPPPIVMDEQELEFTDHIKYLGMTIQPRLSWTAHVLGQIKKANMLLNRARTINGREWGLDPERALWIYTAIARPKLTYGPLVWAHSLDKTLHRK